METIVRHVLAILFTLGYLIAVHVLMYRWIFSPMLSGEWEDEFGKGRRGRVYSTMILYGTSIMTALATYLGLEYIMEKVQVLIDIYFLLT